MELRLRDLIKIHFAKDLERAQRELQESRKKFSKYQETLNAHVKADIKNHLSQLNTDLKKIVLGELKPPDFPQLKEEEELIDEYAHLLKGQAKQDYKESKQVGGFDFSNSAVLQSKDLELVFREMNRLKASEAEARQELLEMQNLIRKQRML
jgi:hypothetical protein